MKAIRIHEFGDPGVMKLEETPDPEPVQGQILIRVKAIGVNPVETYIRSGKYGPRAFPFTPGNDVAGVIECLGCGVGEQFKINDRVYTDKTLSGAYAELVLCDVGAVHPLPDHISFKEGAGVGTPGGTAYRGLFQRGRGVAGETVLIHGGTGGVGTAAIQLARAAGLTVVASAGSEKGRKYALDHGAHHAVEHQITQHSDQVMALTGGKGFDLILEMMADKNLASDLTSVARGGRVVIIGSRGPIEINPRDIMSREADILGLMLFGATEKEHRALYSALTAALGNKTFRPEIGKEFSLADAPKAHKEIIDGDSHGKIVLIP